MPRQLKHFQNQSLAEASALLAGNRITYAVLDSIIQNECQQIFSDLNNILIVYSGAPYPVWVFQREVNADDTQKIADCLKKNFPLSAGYSYVISSSLFNRLKEIDLVFAASRCQMPLYSYRLDHVNEFPAADGKMVPAKAEWLDELARYDQAACYEMEGFVFSEAECRRKMLEKINAGSCFVWLNKNGTITAMATKQDNQEFSKIASVYTLKKERRKGYALNLVGTLSKQLLAEGKIPILYTDGAYEASNRCYQKLGYKQVGALLTIESNTKKS